MSKIYTKTGDQGTTSLFGAGRVSKAHPRVVAYGEVDETNATIGVARTWALQADDSYLQKVNKLLERIQADLFVVGADLATPEQNTRYPVPRITPAHTAYLETCIDTFDAELPPLKAFILPGGTPVAAQLHVARTVCRRAERAIVQAFHADESINLEIVRYMNRLSDLLFVLARWTNHQAGISELSWHPATP